MNREEYDKAIKKVWSKSFDSDGNGTEDYYDGNMLASYSNIKDQYIASLEAQLAAKVVSDEQIDEALDRLYECIKKAKGSGAYDDTDYFKAQRNIIKELYK